MLERMHCKSLPVGDEAKGYSLKILRTKAELKRMLAMDLQMSVYTKKGRYKYQNFPKGS